MDDYISRENIKNVELMFYKAYRKDNKEERLAALLEIGVALNQVPAADVQPVVYCRDCIHRPYTVEPGKRFGFAVETPDRECKCPCYNSDDGWYSWIPDDDFFCGNGERLRAKMGGADG